MMHLLAYIDPGVGALIWQSIIGVFVGMLFYLRKTRKWLGRLMGKVFHLGEKPANSEVDLPMNKSKMEADHL
jgi:hypothetical protein